MIDSNLKIDPKRIHKNLSEKPVVAFMPVISSLGETIPLIEIARKYEKLGGKAIFIGLKGMYTDIIINYGFKFIPIEINLNYDFKDTMQIVDQQSDEYHYNKKKLEDIVFSHFSKNFDRINDKIVEEEVKKFKKEKVQFIVTGYHLISKISAKKANLPIMFIISGVASLSYYKSNYATFPENYENIITKLIPMSIKNRLINKYILRSKMSTKDYNRYVKKYNLPKLNHFYELFRGDYTLFADDINLLNLKPQKKLPSEKFIGPIIANKFNICDNAEIDNKIEKHLCRPGRSILVSMGSSTAKNLVIKIIETLNKLEHNAVIAYSRFEKDEKKPEFNNNVIFFETVPSIIKVNKKVDLAIIHGGRGTVYTAVYSGKPVIGIPMQVEQQYNLDNLVRHKTAIRLSKKNFSEKKLINAINKIFNNYDKYLDNAQKLKEKIQKPNGAENAAKIIYKIVNLKNNSIDNL